MPGFEPNTCPPDVPQYAPTVRHGPELDARTYAANKIPVRIENDYAVFDT